MSPVHQNLVLRGISFVCYMYPTIVAEPYFPLAQSCAIALFACCGQDLVLVLLMGLSVATLGLSWVRTDVFQRCISTKLQGIFLVFVP